LEIAASGKIAHLLITQDMYKETGAKEDEVEGFVNFARNVQGVEVGILFSETTLPNQIKVSFRSKGKVDVSRIAKLFSGGGHRNASGCTIQGSLEEIKQKIINAVSQEVNKAATAKGRHSQY